MDSLALAATASTPDGNPARRRILDFATERAHRLGVDGITIGTLAADLGMSKSGLFAHFGSKVALQAAIVSHATDEFLRKVAEPALSQPRGRSRLNTLLDAWLRYAEQPGGCFFLGACAELDGRSGAIRDQVGEFAEWWLGVLQEEIEAAVSQGELAPDVSPPELAFELHAFVMQANAGFQMFGDPAWLAHARKAIARRLNGVLPPAATVE
ncbi:MAG: TetR/AcrR family transcriptional regulator [Bryobacteraceae bacterium]|nr:TetR/AcrR family transcriptional regulator [Bryobacteraceae bacterium]